MTRFTETTTYTVTCPRCGSNRVRKHGMHGNHQRYRCSQCERAFRRDAPPLGRKVPPNIVGTALDMYYGGMSYKRVAESLANTFDIPEPSTRSVYKWVGEYTGVAEDTLRDHKPRTGDEWVADEMQVKVGGERYWLWNIMDSTTRYILASYLSPRRTTQAGVELMRRAQEASGNLPKTIKTDRLKSYIDAIERVFGGDVKHVQSEGLRAEVNNNRSERLQGTYRARTKVLRGLKTRRSGQRFLDGWAINYNLFRPHMSLKGRTPAQAAAMAVPFSEWEDVAKLDVPKADGAFRDTSAKRRSAMGIRRKRRF